MDEFGLYATIGFLAPTILRVIWQLFRATGKAIIKVDGDRVRVNLNEPEQAELFLKEVLSRTPDGPKGSMHA